MDFYSRGRNGHPPLSTIVESTSEATDMEKLSLKSDADKRNKIYDQDIAESDIASNKNKRKLNVEHDEHDAFFETFNNALSFKSGKKQNINGTFTQHDVNNDTANQKDYKSNNYSGYSSTLSDASIIPPMTNGSINTIPVPYNISDSSIVSNLKCSLSSPSLNDLTMQTSKYGRDLTACPVISDSDDMELITLKKRKH